MSTKRAIVTGASEGIGREFAVQLVAAGYHVTGVARNKTRLSSLKKQLGPVFDFLVADLSTAPGLKRATTLINSKHCDLFINNAGYGIYGRFQDKALASYENLIDLNVVALVSLSHSFVNQAKAGDSLINVSSGLGFLPYAGSSIYAASKAFVSSFSESLWVEQRERGVYVMDLCPGVTRTQFHFRASSGQTLDRSRLIVQESDQVVKKALKELEAHQKPTVFSGLMTLIGVSLGRILTRRQLVLLMAKGSKH